MRLDAVQRGQQETLDVFANGHYLSVSKPAGPLPRGTLSFGGFFYSLTREKLPAGRVRPRWQNQIEGVAEWDTKLTHALPEERQASLPTNEQIEAELRREAMDNETADYEAAQPETR